MADAANWISLGCVGGMLIVCGLALYLLLFGWRAWSMKAYGGLIKK